MKTISKWFTSFALACLLLGTTGEAQSILGKHPFDQFVPAFWTQNGNLAALVAALNSYNATNTAGLTNAALVKMYFPGANVTFTTNGNGTVTISASGGGGSGGTTNVATLSANGLMASNQVAQLNAAQVGSTTLSNVSGGDGTGLGNVAGLAAPFNISDVSVWATNGWLDFTDFANGIKANAINVGAATVSSSLTLNSGSTLSGVDYAGHGSVMAFWAGSGALSWESLVPTNNLPTNLAALAQNNGGTLTNVTLYAAGSAFVKTIPGLVGYWSPDSFIGQTNGTVLTNFPDLSGNGNAMTNWTNFVTFSPDGINGQAGFYFNPVYNGAGVYQSGGSVMLSPVWNTNLNTNFTLVIVYKDLMNSNTANFGGGQVLFGGGTNNAFYYAASSYNGSIFNSGNAALLPFNGGNTTLPKQGNQRVVTLVIRNTGTALDLWQDGLPVMSSQYNAFGGSAGVVGNQFFLGSSYRSDFGNGWVPDFAFKGLVGEVMVFSNAVPDSSVWQINAYLKNKYKRNADNLILGGDSLFFGSFTVLYTNFNYCLSRRLPNWDVDVIAYPGRNTGQIYTNTLPALNSLNPDHNNIFVIMGGANDLTIPSVTFANVKTNLLNTFYKIRQAGGRGIVCTLPSNLYEAGGSGAGWTRDQLNTWIVANYSNFTDGLADFAADPNIGGNGQYTNTVYYYSDGIHYSGVTPQMLVDNYLLPAIANVMAGPLKSTNQTITVSGDASGSGATAITLTLPTVATPGTATKVTYNAKGLVTSGTTLAAGDIPALPESGVTSLVSDLAGKLSGNQTITVSGDASGSGATAITLTLPNIATPGTGLATINAKGQATATSLNGATLTNLTGGNVVGAVPLATTAGGAPPTGAAGGGLTGTYPNPTVSSVGSAALPAAQITGTVAIANGGTGATTPVTASAAVGSQYLSSGEFTAPASATPSFKGQLMISDNGGGNWLLGYGKGTTVGNWGYGFNFLDAASFGDPTHMTVTNPASEWQYVVNGNAYNQTNGDGIGTNADNVIRLRNMSPYHFSAVAFNDNNNNEQGAVGWGNTSADIYAGWLYLEKYSGATPFWFTGPPANNSGSRTHLIGMETNGNFKVWDKTGTNVLLESKVATDGSLNLASNLVVSGIIVVGSGASQITTAAGKLNSGAIDATSSISAANFTSSVAGASPLGFDVASGSGLANVSSGNLGIYTASSKVITFFSGPNNMVMEGSGAMIEPRTDGAWDLGASATRFGNVFAKTSLNVGVAKISSGSVTPNGNVTGSVGDLYTWTGGGAGPGTNSTLWVKESGAASNTGWVGK